MLAGFRFTTAGRPILPRRTVPTPNVGRRTFVWSKGPQQRLGHASRETPPRSPLMQHWRRNLLVGASGVGGVYYVSHLEQVPETGRYRFMDVSPAMEAEMANETYQSVLQQYGGEIMSHYNPVAQYVSHVASRIVSSAGLGRVVAGHGQVGERKRGQAVFGNMFGSSEDAPKEWTDAADVADNEPQWEIYVINDPKTRNAFVLPNRKIFVFTGILPVAGGEDGLATVLGHEIAHQVVRHGAERMSQIKVLMVLGYLLYFLGLDLGLTNLGLTLLLQLPNSRKQESEADRVGLMLMARACFDPREAPGLWVRMDQAEGQQQGGALASIDFLSTHPSNDKRMKQLESWIPEALDARATSTCPTDVASRFEEFREEFSKRLNVPKPGSVSVPSIPRQEEVDTGFDEPATFDQERGPEPDAKPVSSTDEQWLKWIGAERRK